MKRKSETFRSWVTYHAETERARFGTTIATGSPWRFPSTFASGRGLDALAGCAESRGGAGGGDGRRIPAATLGALTPPLWGSEVPPDPSVLMAAPRAWRLPARDPPATRRVR